MFINILVIILLSFVLWAVVNKNQSNYHWKRYHYWTRHWTRHWRRRFNRNININNWGIRYLNGIIADIRRINSLPDVVTKYQKEMDNIMKWKRRGIYFNRRRDTLQNVITKAQNAPSIDALIDDLQGRVRQQKTAIQTAKKALVKKLKQIKHKAAVARKKAVAKLRGKRGKHGKHGKHGMKASNKHGNYYFYFNS